MTPSSTPKAGKTLKDDELLRGFHVHSLMGGDGSIQFTRRTILRQLGNDSFMLSEPEEIEPELRFANSNSRVGTTTARIIAIDIDEVRALVRKVVALEAASSESALSELRKMVEAEIKSCYANEPPLHIHQSEDHYQTGRVKTLGQILAEIDKLNAKEEHQR